MGLLDEAIREHLDLKRRTGADPSEVDRQEREALGPVRRSPQDPADVALDEESPAGGAYMAGEEPPYPLDEAIPEWADAPEEPSPFDDTSGLGAGAPPAEEWSEPPTQIAHVPPEAVEPAPERTESPRHHEIAEEWEAHERGLAAEPAGFEPDEPAPAPPAPAPDPYTAPPPADTSAGPLSGAERQRSLPPEGPELDQETAEYHLEEELEPEPAEPPEDEDVLEETPEFLQDTPDHDRLWFEQRPPRDFDFDK